MPEKSVKRFWQTYYTQLEGATITSVRVEFGPEGAWPIIIFRLRDGSLVETGIACDEEGNGPGYIDNLPREAAERARDEAMREEPCGYCEGQALPWCPRCHGESART